MCQLDWFKGYPDNGLRNILGGMSVKVFLEHVNTE